MRLHQAQYWSALERVWESAVQDLSKAWCVLCIMLEWAGNI
jgi:hypothetical protein